MRRTGQPEIYVGRRFGEFAKLHKRLRTEFPGKILPPLPRKNRNSVTSAFFGTWDEDSSSLSSVSTQDTGTLDDGRSTRNLIVRNGQKRSASRSSYSSRSRGSHSPTASGELAAENVTLYREEQRVSLRAFLRTLLQNQRIAESKAMDEFLTIQPVILNEEELIDTRRRKELDARRIEEQKRFYEIARKRAQELDVYMEKFRQDIVEGSEYTIPCMGGHEILIKADQQRWLDEAIPGDQSEADSRRTQSGISKIRGVVAH